MTAIRVLHALSIASGQRKALSRTRLSPRGAGLSPQRVTLHTDDSH
jgi:hypothetical protein